MTLRSILVAAAAVSALLFTASAGRAETDYVYDYQTKRLVNRSQVQGTGIHRAARSDRSPIRREVVRIEGYAPDTIVVNTAERRLYYVMPGGRAVKYGVGVGREGFTWAGTNRVTRKAEWPGWTPPSQMIRREAAKGRKLPAYMPGGPDNPLGARAMYIGSTLYRIHGTNQPWTIGQAMSSGCIRMANEDVVHLYDQVSIGTKVVVLR